MDAGERMKCRATWSSLPLPLEETAKFAGGHAEPGMGSGAMTDGQTCTEIL
jgi:hypothetical protein